MKNRKKKNKDNQQFKLKLIKFKKTESHKIETKF